MVGCLLGASGCGRSSEDRIADLQVRLDEVHDDYLERRALDPYSTGAAALQVLDPSGQALETATGPNLVTVVVPVSAGRLGACLRITVRAGAGGADRGAVTTEPVDCPIGGRALRDVGMDADVLTTDLQPRSDDVASR